jgi:hypothetical protein
MILLQTAGQAKAKRRGEVGSEKKELFWIFTVAGFPDFHSQET